MHVSIFCSRSSYAVHVLTVSCVLLLGLASCLAEPVEKVNRWEPAIAAMEASDLKSPPPRDGIVFVGSSSIRLWDLAKSFPDLPAINRGFGGSHVADSVHFAERIILPARPRVVVVYAGDNDIAAGKSPEQVCADVQSLVTKIHSQLPKTRIVYVSIKPSIARWKLVTPMRKANRRVQEFFSKDERLVFLDIDTPMLGDDGTPRKELFVDDGLHMSDQGYAIWTRLVMPHLVALTKH